mgnify:CR=1 FL=1
MNALVSNVLTQVFITLIAVSGIYVLTGLTGMFSLGQAAFMAIGSYVSGLLVIRAHVPFVLAALLAVAGATLIGYVIGYPVVRLRRDYISLVTLGFGEAIAALLNRMTTLTGGASGLTGIPRLVGLPLAFVSAVLAIALAAFFKTSKYGRQCIALKGDELAAKAMGINVTRVKMIAFLLSVALTSYSGALYAFYMSYVDPTGFGWKKSADWVIMVFFGGVNSLTGSTLGAFILSALPQVLRGLQNYRYVIYAVLVLLILNFKPSGLLGEWELTPRNIQQLLPNWAKRTLPKRRGKPWHCWKSRTFIRALAASRRYRTSPLKRTPGKSTALSDQTARARPPSSTPFRVCTPPTKAPLCWTARTSPSWSSTKSPALVWDAPSRISACLRG